MLAPGDRADHAEDVRTVNERIGERLVHRLVRQIPSAREVAYERAPLGGRLIADRPAERRVRGLERVEHAPDRGRVGDLDANLWADAHERAEVRRQRDPDGRHAIVCTSTDSTAGRCSTIGRHESPESGDA